MVVSPEFEVSFTIIDATGRTVMSGKMPGCAGVPPASDPNSLLTWSCQAHDTVTNVSGFGNCLESRSIDALGNTTKSLTDGAGRTLRSIDQLGNATVFTNDAGGNQLSVRDPNNVGQDVVYDSLGRAGLTTDTANHTTNSTYNKAGNRIAAIDGKNRTTSYSFDARGRKKSQTDRLGGVTSFTYLASGQLASMTDAESQITNYTYDDAGGKLTEQYPDHTSGSSVGASGYGIVTFTLDAAGRVSRKQDQKGDTVTFNYDLAGRLSTRDYRTAANSPSGAITDSDQFSYDKAGRMLTAYSGRYSNTVGYTYDAAGRKKTESLTIAGQTYTTTTEYNARGELTKYTYPDSTVVDRTYTARGELYQLKHAGTTIDTRAYDNGGRMSNSTYNNGVVDTRAYGSDNTLSSITFTGSGTSIGNLSYGWDNNHNKISETITGTMSSYGFSIPTDGYDGEDRLVSFNRTSGLSQTWNLTAVGDWNSVTTNGTAQTRTHGPTHELLTGGGSNVDTDVKGNITFIPASLRASAASLTSTWDFDNRMISATTGSTTVSHQYDALGRRVARTSGGTTTVYVQVGQQTIADYASGVTPASSTYRYLYASYIDEPVMRWTTSSSTAVYYHRNQQYSVTALTDASGAVLERYAYTAYGVPTIANASGTVLSSSAQSNRYTYTGREWDNDIQQYHYRARVYDASLGKFCSRDPIGYEGGPSVYLYVLGRVLGLVDPSGLKGFIDGWPYWGEQPYPFKEKPKTPSWTSWLYNITNPYAQYAAYHCANSCACSALRKLVDGVDPEELGLEAGGIATKWSIIPGEFSDGVLSPEDIVEAEDGTYHLNGDGPRAHSALRHCIASGFIASALRNCQCAACIADARDMYQYHWEKQSPTSTQQAFFNNREGRLCAGCIGSYANVSGEQLPDDDGDFVTPPPFAEVDFASKAKIVDCCKNKLKKGVLGTSGNAPIGGPGYPVLPPAQWPMSPKVVPPDFKWPGLIHSPVTKG